MSRSRQRIPSYRHHKSSGQAVVTLSSRDVYLGKHGTPESRQRYEQVVAEWLASHKQTPASSRSGALPAAKVVDINGLFLAYWTFCQSYYVNGVGNPTGECSNIKYSVRPLVELFGSVAIGDVRPSTLKAVRDKMVAADLARKTINARINRIRRMFKWGVENDLIDPSVLHGLQAVSALRRGRGGVRESNGVKPVPDALIEEVIPHMPPTVQAMVRVQQYTGMRPGELVIMRTRDLEIGDGVWEYRPSAHKTEHLGHERVIYIGKRAQDYLESYLSKDLDAFVFDPRKAMQERNAQRKTHRRTTNTDRKTARKLRDRYDAASYLRTIYYACDAAFPPPHPLAKQKLDTGRLESDKVRRERLTKAQLAALNRWQKDHRWHPHQLRHNAATYLRKQFGLEAARTVLGHRSAAVTEIYAELDQLKAAEVMKEVG